MKKKDLKLDPKAELGRVKKLGEDFKKFISRGNVVDMAVGVVVGGAFSKIVTSLVNDVITPAIGVLLGGLDFSSLRGPIFSTSRTSSSPFRYFSGFSLIFLVWT